MHGKQAGSGVPAIPPPGLWGEFRVDEENDKIGKGYTIGAQIHSPLKNPDGGASAQFRVLDHQVFQQNRITGGTLVLLGYRLVPGAGVEPALPCGKRILSPLCLPFHHPGRASHCRQGLRQ